jgi:predicted ATPase/DNA-binding CsgD family transcriptional regulator
VALFADRAAAASGTFTLDSSNQEAVVALCRRLDGLPLAIELAAVRTRVLSPDQILGRLTDRFALLTGGGRAALPRQQTLRTTIDWSHDLLTADEQKLLRRLGVFAGRFIVDDVEGVCAFDEQAGVWVLDCLAALVDKSLVAKEEVAGTAAYRLHETMREYANERLRDAGEVEALDDAYTDYYRARFRDLRADLLRDISVILHSGVTAGHRTLDWLEMVDLEIDNIRSALQKCVDRNDWRRGFELATSIGYYWVTRGTAESTRWLDDMLAAAGRSAAVPARAYYFRGWLSIVTGDVTAGRSWLARAIATARAADDVAALSEAQSVASVAEGMAGDMPAAQRLLDEANAIASRLDHYPAVIAALHARAFGALLQGDLNEAEAASSEGARVSHDIGDLYYHETMLMNLGFVALVRRHLTLSRSHFAEALRIAAAIDNRLGQSTLLRGLAANAVAAGDGRLAARLFGAADALVSSDIGGASPFAVEFGRERESAEASLGAPKFDLEYSAGQRLNRDAALQLALGQRQTDSPDAATNSDYGVLAKREAEVAELIAEGLSNKQIGGRLFISERTVATHVRNILNKLGFDSRAQIASWVSSPRS